MQDDRGNRWRRSASLLAVAALGFATLATAQNPPLPNPAGPDGKPLAAVAIELKDVPGRKGERAALFQGVARPQGVYLRARNNWVLTPLALSVITEKATDAVDVQLYKEDDPRRPARALTTGPQGTARLQFRTQGDYLVRVSAVRDTPFQLLVWAGTDLKPDLAPPFSGPRKAPAKGDRP